MELLINILGPMLGLFILFICFAICSWLYEKAKWMMNESHPTWVRLIVPIFVVILTFWGLAAWWGIMNLACVMILLSLFLMMPKGHGKWRGGFSDDVNKFGAYVFYIGLFIVIIAKLTD